MTRVVDPDLTALPPTRIDSRGSPFVHFSLPPPLQNEAGRAQWGLAVVFPCAKRFNERETRRHFELEFPGHYTRSRFAPACCALSYSLSLSLPPSLSPVFRVTCVRACVRARARMLRTRDRSPLECVVSLPLLARYCTAECGRCARTKATRDIVDKHIYSVNCQIDWERSCLPVCVREIAKNSLKGFKCSTCAFVQDIKKYS